MKTGLLNTYRALAYATGVMLLLLVAVAMPLKYFAHSPGMVQTVGFIHGWLYFTYAVVCILVGFQRRLPFTRILPMLAAGFVPFVAFIMERKVMRDLAAEAAKQQSEQVAANA